MKRISQVDRFTKQIYKFGDINIKHVVTLSPQTTTGNNYKESNGFAYEYYMNQYKKQGLSVAFKTTDGIYIEAAKKLLPDPKDPTRKIYEQGIPNKSYMSYNDIYEVETMFESGKQWLISEKYTNIFNYDSDTGKPYSINSNYRDLHYVTHLKNGVGNKFIIIQPQIIQDMNNSYTGIVFKNEKGIIGTVTSSEYLNMIKLIINLLNNLYTNSLSLCHIGQQYVQEK